MVIFNIKININIRQERVWQNRQRDLQMSQGEVDQFWKLKVDMRNSKLGLSLWVLLLPRLKNKIHRLKYFKKLCGNLLRVYTNSPKWETPALSLKWERNSPVSLCLRVYNCWELFCLFMILSNWALPYFVSPMLS